MSTEFFNDQWRIPSNENQNKVSNYSMDFNGTSDFIDCGDSDKFSFGNGTTDSPFSLSAWVKPDSTTKFKLFGKFDSSNTNYEYQFGTSNSKILTLSLYNQNTADRIQRYYNNPLTSLDWQHWVATYDGSGNPDNIKIYINGVQVGDTSVTVGTYTAMQNTAAPLLIASESVNYANGKIDQVTVFDYALSQDQVTQLGAEGYAFNFAGSPQGIDCGTGSRFDIDQITVSGWAKLESGLTSTQIIAGLRNASAGSICYQLQNSGSSSKFRFVIRQEDGTYVDAVANDIHQYNTWYHVVGVADGSNVKLYVNGVLQTDVSSYDGTIESPNENFNIGRQPSPAFYYWIGELSNISVFNTGLQESDVQTLYNSGKPGNISSLNPIGWWKLDDTATFNSGTSVWSIPDDSSNSNTGTSVGMNSSNLVASNINGELIANPMATSPKPIAYYQLGDQSVDNGANYLVPNNSLSDYVFNFSTNNESINLGNSFNYPSVVADPWTISFWVKPTNDTSGGVVFSGYSVANNRGFYALMRSTTNPTPGNRRLQCLIRSNSNIYSSVATTTSLALNEWTHVAVCYGGGGSGNFPYSFTVYFNNSPVSIVVFGGNIGTPAGSVGPNDNKYIGSGDNASYLKNAELSELSFLKYKLSASQVDTLYNNGKPGDISSLNPFTSYELNASEIFNSTSTEWSVDNNVYPSVYKSSLNFDGSNDTINLSNNSVFNLGTSFTISGWFNFSSNKYQGLISFDATSGGSPRGWFLFQIDTNNDIRLFDGTTVFTLKTSYTTTNQWDSFIVTYDGTDLVFYINGNQESTQSVSVDLQTNGNDAQIGNNQFASGRFFDGEMSNIAFWNVGLTPTQVATLYNNGRPEASISHSPVSWWKLDNTTTGIQDSAGSNNGTNNGATEYAGFVNVLGGESSGMDSSNLVVSDLQQTSGYSPYALDFDGIDDYLTMTSTDFKGSGGTVSYSFWVKPETYGNPPGIENFGYFISDSSTGGGIAYSEGSTGFGLTPGQMYLYNITNAGVVATTTSTFIDENVWNHIVVVFNTGNIVQFYKNGSISSTLTGITSYNATFDTIAARRYPGGVNNPVNGELSNFSIFDTALTSTQVTEINNQGRPSDLNTFSGTAPVAWWQLGSNSSFNTNWTCLDEIGTNNAVSAGGMTNDAITDGPGYSGSGLGTSSIDIKGDAPYSTANGLSENMDVLDRTTDVPS